MTGEILTASAIRSFYLIDELHMLDIAALWSGNTPQYKWPGGGAGALKKLARPDEFSLKLDELSDAVARFKLAESSFDEEKDHAEQEAELLKNDPTLYLVPTTFRKKRHLIRPPKNSPLDPTTFLPEPLKTTITRKELARYAIATNQNPGFLMADINKLNPASESNPENLPFMDPANEHHYVEELKIAVEVWLHFFENGYSQNEKPKKQIRRHLDQYHKISPTARDRIATMINPSKGGPTPTPE